jgi:hypothetical protein
MASISGSSRISPIKLVIHALIYQPNGLQSNFIRATTNNIWKDLPKNLEAEV